MKYTDRKIAPLKWHRFLTYIGLPLLSLYLIYNMYNLINELFGLQLPFARILLTPILAVFGATVSNLGPCFWYVIAYFTVAILMTILLIYVCIGFFKWNNNARIGWLYYLFIRTLESGLLCVGAFVLYLQWPVLFSSFGYSFYNVSLNVQMTLGVFIFTFVLELIIWILNVIYYNKRKMLFVDTYLPYQETPSATAQPTTVSQPPVASQEEVVSDIPPVEKPEEVVTPTEEAEPIIEPIEEPSVITTPVEDTTPEVKELSEEEKKEELRFCPNCGAALGENDQVFCTHCGTKLK